MMNWDRIAAAWSFSDLKNRKSVLVKSKIRVERPCYYLGVVFDERRVVAALRLVDLLCWFPPRAISLSKTLLTSVCSPSVAVKLGPLRGNEILERESVSSRPCLVFLRTGPRTCFSVLDDSSLWLFWSRSLSPSISVRRRWWRWWEWRRRPDSRTGEAAFVLSILPRMHAP